MPFIKYAALLSGLLHLSTAIVPLGPSLKLFSELSPADQPDVSDLGNFVGSEVFIQTDTLVLKPEDGLSLTCDTHGNYRLTLNPKDPHAINFANYMQQGPIVVSNAFSKSCPSLSTTTVFGANDDTPDEWKKLAAENPDLQYTVLQPLYVSRVSECTIKFTAAVKDYHSIFGAINDMSNPDLDWMKANVEPWDDVIAAPGITKRFLLTSLVVSSAVGHFFGAALLGGAATGVILATQ
ncbi:uncharacterized protein AB675_3693 [Cyphellophora attinorum]|uniref:Uncharacterized protein n=1 Tax=Cyphellophora attinorum TaxID=1664694 RepID=A0A0N0NJT4_9EURO|nr:uncharacterized protein AB675_3693 [Phialophora attinorum]KPI37019.1 hypothetical protein AB675_3693 [Phialophora attinorum]